MKRLSLIHTCEADGDASEVCMRTYILSTHLTVLRMLTSLASASASQV